MSYGFFQFNSSMNDCYADYVVGKQKPIFNKIISILLHGVANDNFNINFINRRNLTKIFKDRQKVIVAIIDSLMKIA